MEKIGLACIGFVFGYLLYYSVKHTDKFDISLLSTAIGAIGSQAVITWLGQIPGWIGPYGIGLFLGFVSYFVLSLVLIPKNRENHRRAALVKILLGKQI